MIMNLVYEFVYVSYCLSPSLLRFGVREPEPESIQEPGPGKKKTPDLDFFVSDPGSGNRAVSGTWIRSAW
jgi:hypothetical protein